MPIGFSISRSSRRLSKSYKCPVPGCKKTKSCQTINPPECGDHKIAMKEVKK